MLGVTCDSIIVKKNETVTKKQRHIMSYQPILTFLFFVFALLNAFVLYFFPWYTGNTILSLPLIILGFLLVISMLWNSKDPQDLKDPEDPQIETSV